MKIRLPLAVVAATAAIAGTCGYVSFASTPAPTAWHPTSSATAHPVYPRVSATPVGVSGKWKMIWSDEFNGKTLDASKWTRGWPGWSTTVVKPSNYFETACYDPANVTLPGDGTMHLTLTQKTETCGGVTRPYAGAAVVSLNKFQYTYGVAEARVYLPGTGSKIYNWPNFWGNGASLNWPADGENDTFEGLNGKACWHFHSNAGGPGNCTTFATPGWHTVASNWEPGKVTYYYDGHLVGTITTGITSKPQYLTFQLTQSPTWAGPVAVNKPYLVDYVRVWQKA